MHCCVYYLPKSFGFASTTAPGCPLQMGAASDARWRRSHTNLGDLWHHLEDFASYRGWCSLPALQSYPSTGTLPSHDPSQLLPQLTMGIVVFPLTVLAGLGKRRLAVPLCHRQHWNSSSSCSKAAPLLLTSRQWFLLGWAGEDGEVSSPVPAPLSCTWGPQLRKLSFSK